MSQTRAPPLRRYGLGNSIARGSVEEKGRYNGIVWAKEATDSLFDGSEIKDQTKSLPKFHEGNIQLGSLLREGRFASLHEVASFESHSAEKSSIYPYNPEKAGSCHISEAIQLEEDQLDELNIFTAQQIQENCIRVDGSARYMIKAFRHEIINDSDLFIQGVQYMMTESRILSSLSHPNIIKLQATSTVDAGSEFFFMVFDRLYESLDHHLERWSAGKTKGTFRKKGLFRKKEKKLNPYDEKVLIMLDLSNAVHYLHTNKIVHRQLAPENIGFSVRGVVKLLDFFKARVLTKKKELEDGTYRLSGMGSLYDEEQRILPYIAPEVGLNKSHSTSCDVFSFSVLCWHILSCKIPFSKYDGDLSYFRNNVWNASEQERPHIDSQLPSAMKIMLRRGWKHDLHDRHRMKSCKDILTKEVQKIYGDQADLLLNPENRHSLIHFETDGNFYSKMERQSSFASTCSRGSTSSVGSFCSGGSLFDFDDDDVNEFNDILIKNVSGGSSFCSSGDSSGMFDFDDDDENELNDILAKNASDHGGRKKKTSRTKSNKTYGSGSIAQPCYTTRDNKNENQEEPHKKSKSSSRKTSSKKKHKKKREEGRREKESDHGIRILDKGLGQDIWSERRLVESNRSLGDYEV